jgi:two-component system sensor histidine kinase KdpD
LATGSRISAEFARIAPRLLAWIALAALATLAMHELRPWLDKTHIALGYLLIVLAASARSGRLAGLTLSFVCFLAFNFFMLPPNYTLAIADPRDWLVLLAFLLTGGVGAELFHRVRRQASLASLRAAELDRLGMLGAETLAAGRVEDAARAIARVTQTQLGVEWCEIHVPNEDTDQLEALAAASSAESHGASIAAGLLRAAVERGVVVVERLDGTTHLRPAGEPPDIAVRTNADARVLLIPLRVRERVVGVLVLADPAGVRVGEDAARLVAPLAYYAALIVERARLSGKAERAESLQQADRLKDALLASVSHDLRTPLTTIKAMASEIRREGDDRAATIEVEADRLNRMVADLLDFSRARARAMPVRTEMNAAEDLVGSALQQLAGVRGANRIQVHLDPGQLLAVGRFDFVLALRALVNLLDNALKHASPDSPIELRVRSDATFLYFDVEDHGPGVPPEEVDRIFEPFYRRSSSHPLAPGSRGAGLGLAIARSLAEAQNGTVTYTPTPTGGSRFTLALPAGSLPAA